jgi:hypothetical protein
LLAGIEESQYIICSMPLPPRPRASKQARRLKAAVVVACVLLALVATLLGLRSPMVHQYEYQEDLYVSLDGRASVYVSASLPALVALHGMKLSVDPRSAFDRAQIQRAFSGPGVTISAISTWRRHRRRFVSVRLDTADIRRLPAVAPFAAASFEFSRVKDGYRLLERLGASADQSVGNVGWTGGELVGFRWHIPSRVERYNTPEENFLRGNILVWEQPLRDRLRGVPLTLDARMETQSILYRTLWLFGATFVAVAVGFVIVIWWVFRRGAQAAEVS